MKLLLSLTSIMLAMAVTSPATARGGTPGPPVATYIAAAAAFWDTHTSAPRLASPTWTWNGGQCGQSAAACATLGTGLIWLVRPEWDRMRRQDKCVLVIHEYGHAAYGFQHTPGGIMAGDATTYDHPPGACLGQPFYARRGGR